MSDSIRRALILSGGGARAAYQAGVLRALAQWLPAGSASPFTIVCGTSAGAINAAALAASANDIGLAAEKLCSVWSRLTVHDIYCADAANVAQTGWRWLRCRSQSRYGIVTSGAFSPPWRDRIRRRWAWT